MKIFFLLFHGAVSTFRTLVLFQLSAISREANSCILEVSSASGTLRSDWKKCNTLSEVLTWRPRSARNCAYDQHSSLLPLFLLQSRSTSIRHLLFGFDAELPETSDSECKFWIIGSFSWALKCHSEHCIMRGGCFVLLQTSGLSERSHHSWLAAVLTPKGKTIELNVVANHDFLFLSNNTHNGFLIPETKDRLLMDLCHYKVPKCDFSAN